MSKEFHYVFKKGISLLGEDAVFSKQLAVGHIVADMRNGEIYRVTSITPGTEHKPEMPYEVAQTLPLKNLSELGLSSLRQEYNYPETREGLYYVVIPEKLIAKFDEFLASFQS
jgi:hypothetical protein